MRLIVLALAAALTMVGATPTPAAAAQPPPADNTNSPPPSDAPLEVAPEQRASVLGKDWAASTDRAVVSSGDTHGFHLLAADAASGYHWRTVASLSEAAFEADSWIGNVCVTGSGERAVVVYAPRTFTNRPDLADRGGFVAVVELSSGAVRKLPLQASLAYFNPGCGAGETAVLTQGTGEDLDRTRVVEVDTVTGELRTPIVVPGQLTSPVPTANGIVAADSGALVLVDAAGQRRVLAPAQGVPFRVAADADGGVVFMQQEKGATASVRRVTTVDRATARVDTLATGSLTDLSVTSGRGGQVFVTGKPTNATATTPPSVRLVDSPPGTVMSLGGELAVTEVDRAGITDPEAQRQVEVSATAVRTGKEFQLSTVTQNLGGAGAEPSPALARAVAGTKAAGDPHDPADGDQATCSVPRNDPRNQAMQPKPRQVEWAVDQAITNSLYVSRPVNWKNLGMPQYEPQGLFPYRPLEGGGRIPAQIMLGITAQESNMWQAARFAVPGVTANPLIGNYFGIDYYNDDPADDWTIRWEDADCGYGVTQVTDGMRKPGMGQPTLPYDHQRAIALDFAANVAKGVQMLSDKWNETRKAGLIANHGDPKKIENWFFAVWAYNSGFYPQSAAGQNGGAWGVGWLNNPVNPRYPANRLAFLDSSYSDAAHPQDWPYPEKVMGWAGHPIELIETPGNLVHGYRAAWWTTGENRTKVKPPVTQFCDSTNNCVPGALYTPDDPEVIGEPAGPCAHKNSAGKYDLKCWYHQPNTWRPNCEDNCGNEILRFDPGYAYQADAESYKPNCELAGLPPKALIVDNIPTTAPSIRPNCAKEFSNAGSFKFTFAPNTDGNYPGKIDVHQIGTGFGGQFWMSNTYESLPPARVVTGTWTLDRAVGPWARVLVHLPVVGARTQQARYEIDINGDGTYVKDRYLPQEIQHNGWVSLGTFNFKGVPSIRLRNLTQDGRGVDRIAWDAIAVQPLPGKPKHMVAALGDSYSSGEGAGDYYLESDANHGTPQWNACRRSPHAPIRKVVLFGSGDTLGNLVDRWDPNYELGFVACSGARTTNVTGSERPESWAFPEKYEKGEGQFHEMPQVESGVLDVNTTLVTLTLGGNDYNAFAGALTDCAGLTNCANDPEFIPKYKNILDYAMSNVNTTLNKIHDKAPNAKIVLLGYPELFSRTIKCNGSVWFDMSEVAALGELAAHVATRQREYTAALRARGIQAYDASPINHFVGHGGCDDPAWIHLVREGPAGEGDFHPGDKPSPFCMPVFLGGSCLSRESFHPNQAGAVGYADVLRGKLDEIGYT